MKEKRITFAHFVGPYKDAPYKNNEVFDYSEEMLHKLMMESLEAGFNVMIKHSNESLIVWIDTQRFQQR